MNMNTILWLVGLTMLAGLYYRNVKAQAKINEQEQDYMSLEHKYKALQRTLATRGHRLDVLLSTVSEVVLRVDDLGRVLGGNKQAEILFQFEKYPALPQSMLIFYRDSEWLQEYQKAIKDLPKQRTLPEMNIKGRVFLPRLATLGENEALLLCMDVTAYTQLQRKQKSLLDNLMHDLKTPLTSLLGYARSIEAFADDDELREEAVAVIAHEAKHINDLMNSMLTLNQIEYQQEEMNKACNVVAVAQQVWESLAYDMQQKDVSLDLNSCADELQVHMTTVDCHRVLMNLASNAIKFSPRGSSIICLIEENEKVARISIADEGAGISDKHLPRVTERFYRVDDALGHTKEEGNGLGLSIVKEILDRDGGKLRLSNRESGGLSAVVHITKAE